jgi:hypothetical protein
VSEIDVLVIVRFEHAEDRLDGKSVLDSPERLRCEEPDPSRPVTEEREEKGCCGSVADITQELGCLRSNLGFGVAEEGDEEGCPGRIRTSKLSDPPETVDPSEEGAPTPGSLRERLIVIPLHELELGLGANSHILMSEQSEELGR